MFLPNAIIGGAGRAGSTSLFRYLADHPQVCASSTKETQFFIRHRGAITDRALAEYAEYFSSCRTADQVRIEATPHYLQFADAVAPLIHQTLPDVRLIFILREPSSKLFTTYRNLRQLESQTYGGWTFDQFARQAIDFQAAADHHATDPGLRAAGYMHTGCYAKYLSAYYQIFRPERICVLFFDTLVSTPRELMARVARFLGVDPEFYESYAFSQENRTRAFRSPQLHRIAHRVNQTLEPALNRYPIVRRYVRNAYNIVNEAKKRKEQPSHDTQILLKQFYAPYNSDLRALLQGHGYTELPSWLRE